jgi:hypothetical protein
MAPGVPPIPPAKWAHRRRRYNGPRYHWAWRYRRRIGPEGAGGNGLHRRRRGLLTPGVMGPAAAPAWATQPSLTAGELSPKAPGVIGSTAGDVGC